MIEIAFTPAFKRSFKKKIKERPEIESIYWEKVSIFIQNPFDNKLKTHKLSGKLRFLWSFSVEYDLRVVFHLKKITLKPFLLILETIKRFIKSPIRNQSHLPLFALFTPCNLYYSAHPSLNLTPKIHLIIFIRFIPSREFPSLRPCNSAT